MHFHLRYRKGLALLLSCMLCCSSIVLGQTKQAAETYAAGLSALDKNDTKRVAS